MSYFILYFLVDWYLHNNLPYEYAFYAQHLIVADENYFQSLFKNSPFCDDLVSKNFLFVLFDKWENERIADESHRDTRKCLNPNPNFCGRSPTTLNMKYKKLIEISKDLFARKFDPNDHSSMELINAIDALRSRKQLSGEMPEDGDYIMLKQEFVDVSNNSHLESRCLEMSEVEGRKVKMEICNSSSEKQWFSIGNFISSLACYH